MSPKLKVIVAGAGVLGLASALALARAGARVVLTDPAPLGGNASGVAAGMLAPAMEAVLDPLTRPHVDLLIAARDLWPELAGETGIRLDRTGALAVGDGLEPLHAALEEIGLEAQRLDGPAAAALAPGLTAPDGGLFTPEDWRLDPGQALAALASAALEADVEMRQAPLDLAEPADLRLLALGAEPAADLAPELAVLTPIRGHILRAPAIAYTGAVVRGQGVYATPGSGGLVIGATMEAGARDLSVDPARVEWLRTAGARLFPQVAGAELVAGVGVRAGTPDGLPLVGFSSAPGVLVASGARRNGWLVAPLVAKIVTALVFGEDPGPFAARLAPARFEAGGGAP